jgi:hypothetical protein
MEAPRVNRAVTAGAALRVDGFDASARAARPAQVPTAVPTRALGFEAREVAKPYDAAADLFPGLDWLNPATYQPADPSQLPATQASEIQHMLDAQATRTPEQTAQALDLAHRGTFSLWMDYASQYGKEHGFVKGALLKAKLALALGVDGAVDGVKKLETHEPRPFQVDPRIHMLGD